MNVFATRGEAALDTMLESLRSTSAPEWDSLLGGALAGDGITPVFQPIIDLPRRRVVGYEALARFSGPPGLTPDRWFAVATARGCGAELDAAVLRVALAHRSSLPADCFLTVNLEPDSLISPRIAAVLGAETSLRGLVVEITEHRPITEPAATTRTISWLRERGALIALDDAGAGYAGLQQILLLRPSILKVDRGLIDGIDHDETKAALVEMLGVFASRIDAWLLAEGVETESESRRLSDLGVPLAQGYYYGRPAAPWAAINSLVLEGFEPPISVPRAGSLYGLLEVIPWIAQEDLAEAGAMLARSPGGLLAVLDADRRPLGVLVRDLPGGPLFTPQLTNVNSTVRELAQRLATRTRLDAAPVLVTDNAGRYVGAITMPRLLAALAGL